jgi:hypothetical protein
MKKKNKEASHMAEFLYASNCHTCKKELEKRTESYFFRAAICLECGKKEKEILGQMNLYKMDNTKYRGCRYLPDVRKEFYGVEA